jgi:GDP-L-fucose synthase
MTKTRGNNSVLLTGSTSMIGKFTLSALEDRGYHIITPDKDELNLLDVEQVKKYMGLLYDPFLGHQPKYCIHLAGWNGGIEWNKLYPYTIMDRTLTMFLNLTRFLPDSTKLVSIISSCAYPDFGSEMTENSLWVGPANKTVECHGYAKRMFDPINRCLNKERGMTAVSAIVNNSFGPYDSFHPHKTKVVGALIRKFLEAKQQGLDKVTCWGTGSPLREFVYAKDVGEAMVEVMEVYQDSNQPINITSDQEISIKGLTEIIAEVVGYNGEIVWDTSKPDGQMRKKLSKSWLKFNITPLKDALKETIEWYIENKEVADQKVAIL